MRTYNLFYLNVHVYFFNVHNKAVGKIRKMTFNHNAYHLNRYNIWFSIGNLNISLIFHYLFSWICLPGLSQRKDRTSHKNLKYAIVCKQKIQE